MSTKIVALVLGFSGICHADDPNYKITGYWCRYQDLAAIVERIDPSLSDGNSFLPIEKVGPPLADALKGCEVYENPQACRDHKVHQSSWYVAIPLRDKFFNGKLLGYICEYRDDRS